MDRRTVVTSTAASPETVTVEQAIFTSVPSPTGQGYRVVAASAGVSAEEKREIVQRAPSHGSLCDTTAAGVGVASFTLRSGRRCIFLSCNAGMEHTARGGSRVHTTVLVMEQVLFHRLQCDPLCIADAALPHVNTKAGRGPMTRLDRVALMVPSADEADTANAPANRADAERVQYILAAVLDGRSLVVVNAPRARDMLRWTLMATPTSVRERLSVSYGLKFSASRRFDLMFTDADRTLVERIRNEQDIETLDWNAPPPKLADSPFEPWLAFVRERWETGHGSELRDLAAQLTQDVSAGGLTSLTLLWSALQQVHHADEKTLNQLAQSAASGLPETRTHAELRQALLEQVAARRATLARPAAPPPHAPGGLA